MRTIKQTAQFKRDLKREAKGPRRGALTNDFMEIVKALACDAPLAEKHRDHALTGDWKDHRDCHVKPDLVSATVARMTTIREHRIGSVRRLFYLLCRALLTISRQNYYVGNFYTLKIPLSS